MRFRWPFRRRYVAVLPAAMPLDKYRAMCIGEEVLLMGGHVLKQVRYTPVASMHIGYQTLDGECFEVSVAAKAPERPVIDDPVRP